MKAATNSNAATRCEVPVAKKGQPHEVDPQRPPSAESEATVICAVPAVRVPAPAPRVVVKRSPARAKSKKVSFDRWLLLVLALAALAYTSTRALSAKKSSTVDEKPRSASLAPSEPTPVPLAAIESAEPTSAPAPADAQVLATLEAKTAQALIAGRLDEAHTGYVELARLAPERSEFAAATRIVGEMRNRTEGKEGTP